jgi:predicted CXXCH cytochrome family protein
MLPRHVFSRPLVLGLAALVALAGLVLIVRPQSGPDHATSRPPGYVGAAVCAGCHAEEAVQHAGSPHAMALRTPAEFAQSHPLPAPRWLPDPDTSLAYRLVWRGDSLGLEAQVGSATLWQPMEWAFGSGTQAMTPLGRRADGAFVESPLSYHRRAGWDFTPGFLAASPEGRRADQVGTVMPAEEAADCFACHATGVVRTSQGPDIMRLEPGVQCESCHGPGETHVAEARGRGGKGNLRLPAGSGSGAHDAVDLMNACAGCHRATPPEGVEMTDAIAIRFAPAGFKQSRCYQQSESFSCTSCHDPHRGVEKDPEHYRRVCLGCHDGSTGERPECPQQPAGDCVSCHMPRSIVQRHSFFTDHWIQVPGRPKQVVRHPMLEESLKFLVRR